MELNCCRISFVNYFISSLLTPPERLHTATPPTGWFQLTLTNLSDHILTSSVLTYSSALGGKGFIIRFSKLRVVCTLRKDPTLSHPYGPIKVLTGKGSLQNSTGGWPSVTDGSGRLLFFWTMATARNRRFWAVNRRLSFEVIPYAKYTKITIYINNSKNGWDYLKIHFKDVQILFNTED